LGEGIGVLGESTFNSGVVGTSANGQGITAFSDNGIGLFSQGATWAAVFNGAVVVNNGPPPKFNPTNPNPNPINGSIVINDGNLYVNKGHIFNSKGTLTCFDVNLANEDCAEDFDISIGVEVSVGTVMVLDDDGTLTSSSQAYDKKVVGVISGAGDYKPAIVLGRHGKARANRLPIALMGKVFCKVDAQSSPIAVGDLLTTSDTLGHAMKAVDGPRAFGAVIGKALRPLQAGQGTIPILIALQ
jgi:hypothetical protein